MKLPDRKFTDDWAKAGKRFLGIAINGFSGAGKTFSALRLATGVASGLTKHLGEQIDVWGIDADSGRMSHYDKYFKFRVVNLPPPHGALHFLAAIEHCVKKGAKVIVIDHLSAEHSGEGGLLDQMEAYLDKKEAQALAKNPNGYFSREAHHMASMKVPKEERKVLERRIDSLTDVVFILCYRAADKVKPRKKGEEVPTGEDKIKHLGWLPETTSTLFYKMTARFLLMPGADGKPVLQPETKEEKLVVKMPEMFKGWFKDGFQLDEAMGEKLARWHLGLDEEGKAAPVTPTTTLEVKPLGANPQASAPGARAKQLITWLNTSTSTVQALSRWGQLATEPKEVLDAIAETHFAKLAELKESGL